MGNFGPVQTVIDGEIFQIFLVGNITEADIADEIWHSFESSQKKLVLISFKQVARIDSLSLGAIVKIYKRVGDGLIISEVPPSIMRILISLKFDSYLIITETFEEARSRLKKIDVSKRMISKADVDDKGSQDEKKVSDSKSSSASSASSVDSEKNFLLKALNSKEPIIRAHAVETIGALGLNEAVPELINMLNDKDHVVVMSSIEALGRLGDHRAVEALAKLADSDSEWLQSASVHALGLMKATESIELFKKLVSSPNRLVARNARWALEQTAKEVE